MPFLMMYSRESTSQKVSQAGRLKEFMVSGNKREKLRRRKRYSRGRSGKKRWRMGLVEDTLCGPEGLAACLGLMMPMKARGTSEDHVPAA